MDAIRQKFKESDKVETTNLMSYSMNIEYGNVREIQNFILWNIQAAATLKGLKVHIVGEYIVHQVLNQFPSSYNQLKKIGK